MNRRKWLIALTLLLTVVIIVTYCHMAHKRNYKKDYIMLMSDYTSGYFCLENVFYYNECGAYIDYALFDVNNDDIPELFLSYKPHNEYFDTLSVFKTGDDYFDCFLGEVGFITNHDNQYVLVKSGDKGGLIGKVFTGNKLVDIFTYTSNIPDDIADNTVLENIEFYYSDANNKRTLTEEEYSEEFGKLTQNLVELEYKDLTMYNLCKDLNLSYEITDSGIRFTEFHELPSSIPDNIDEAE